jgi:phenylacetate-CoA ligase
MSDPAVRSAYAELAWPAFADAGGAAMLSMLWQIEYSRRAAPRFVREEQFRQLRILAAHAVAHVPHYAKALKTAGIADAGALDAESFLRWPILRKSELRPGEKALTAARIPREHGRVTHTYTTGSTGEPTRVAHTDVTRFFSDALSIHDHLLHGRDFALTYGAIKSSVSRGRQDGWGSVNALFATGPGVHQSSSLDVDRQLDWLMEERPAYLQSYSSNLLALVQRSAETGRAPVGIREIIGYGDMPPDELPALARATWGARFVATYSSMELGPMASHCPEHGHYLVHAPALYLEVLRDDGSPCAAGETGRVVATSLHNFAMPLIRYEIGDYAEAGEPCGGWPVLRRIVGRYRNMLRDPAGRVRWPSFPGEFWMDVAPVRKVRLVQPALDRIEVQYVMEREFSAEESVRVRALLAAKLGYPFEVTFARLPAIERVPGEKWEDFISLVAPP